MLADSRKATLTHELRNQLNNIAMNAELTKMELTVQGDPGAGPQHPARGVPLECLEAILQACAECAGLVDALAGLADDRAQDVGPGIIGP